MTCGTQKVYNYKSISSNGVDGHVYYHNSSCIFLQATRMFRWSPYTIHVPKAIGNVGVPNLEKDEVCASSIDGDMRRFSSLIS
mgnify:CR=1 FL=1